jgi:hypothetical protein
MAVSPEEDAVAAAALLSPDAAAFAETADRAVTAGTAAAAANVNDFGVDLQGLHSCAAGHPSDGGFTPR